MKRILAIICLLLLMACGDRFKITHSENIGFAKFAYIIEDTETGNVYFAVKFLMGGGVTLIERGKK